MCKTSSTLFCNNLICSCPSNSTGWFWSPSSLKCVLCAAPWINYSAHCYYVNTTPKNWNNAFSWCKSQGSDLMKVDDQAEYNLLYGFYQTFTSGGNLWVVQIILALFRIKLID
jgi:hypothetical protein